MINNLLPQLPSQFVFGMKEENLFEALCSEYYLYEGFRAVRKNGGTVGIDRQSIQNFEANLRDELRKLQKELEEWSYHPQPVRRIEIPKPDGGVRLLGIPTVTS